MTLYAFLHVSSGRCSAKLPLPYREARSVEKGIALRDEKTDTPWQKPPENCIIAKDQSRKHKA